MGFTCLNGVPIALSTSYTVYGVNSLDLARWFLRELCTCVTLPSVEDIVQTLSEGRGDASPSSGSLDKLL